MKMMNYHYNKKKNKRNVILYSFLIVLILLALFTSFYSNLFNFFERPLSFFYKNTEVLKHDSSNFLNFLVYKNKIISDNNKLKNKVKSMETSLMKLEYLESLIGEYENIITYNPDIVFVPIIKKNNKESLIILGGKDINLSIGEKVLDSNGVLIGYISKVFDFTSLINLFTKNEFIFNGVLFNEDNTLSVILKGNGNAMVFEISREVIVHDGDVVYSQEEPGYILGTVSYVSFDPRDPFKKVYVSPVYNIETLQNLGVIHK